MPSIATKSAPKLPAPKTALAKPQSLLAGPDENLIADVEEIRLAIDALAAGEPVDNVAAYRAAAIRRKFTPVLEAIAIEAKRSIGDLSNWGDEYKERSEQIERDEVKWAAEYRRLDVALTAARAAHRAAVEERENLRAENQQNKYVAAVNPFLCGTPAEAAQAITVPALTNDEAARLISERYQPWAVDECRKKKMVYAEREASAGK